MQVTHSPDSRTVTVQELSNGYKDRTWFPPVDFLVRNIQESGKVTVDRYGTDTYSYFIELSREFEKITKLTSATYHIEPQVVLEYDFLRRFSAAIRKTSRLSMSDGIIEVSDHMRLIKARIQQASNTVLDDPWPDLSKSRKVNDQAFRSTETMNGPDHPGIDVNINMDFVWDPLPNGLGDLSVGEDDRSSVSNGKTADTPSFGGLGTIPGLNGIWAWASRKETDEGNDRDNEVGNDDTDSRDRGFEKEN